MIQQKHAYILFGFLLAFLSFSACEVVVDELLDDCNSYNYPVLAAKELTDGKVGVFYSEQISAEIKNDPNDDSDYTYHFSVSNGLSNGVDWFVEGRKVLFEGTPTEKGSYQFTIEVWVEVDEEWWYLNDIPELCDDYDQKTYSIHIEEQVFQE